MAGDPRAEQILKEKMAEKGIKPVDREGLPLSTQKATPDQIMNHKLNGLSNAQTSLEHRLNEITKYLAELDVKLSAILRKLGE